MLQVLIGVLVSLAVLFVPGLLLGTVIGLRRLWLWAAAPLITMTLLAVAAMSLPLLGWQWNLLTATIPAAAFSILVVVLFKFVLRAKFNFCLGFGRQTVLAFSAAAVFLGLVMGLAVTPFTGISQSFDNIFHLNAIKYAVVTGNASPFSIGGFTSPDTAAAFYPGMWHAAVALVMQTAGLDIAVAINTFNFAVMVAVWPLGVLLLTRCFTGASRYGVWIGAALAVSFPVFPLYMLQYGVLYPFFLALAMTPVAFALVLNLLGLTLEKPLSTVVVRVFLLLGLVAGLALTHPQGVMTILALCVPAVTVATFSDFAKLPPRRRVLRTVVFILFLIIGYLAQWKIRPSFIWGERMSIWEALLQTFLLNLMGFGVPVVLAAVTFYGLVRTFIKPVTKQQVVAFGIWLVGALLFFVSAGVPEYLVRVPTRVWYSDAPRLAVVYILALIPLLALTINYLVTRVMRRFKAKKKVGITLLLAVFAVSLATVGYGEMVTTTQQTYALEVDSDLLSSDEMQLLAEVDDIVPQDEVIFGSPWTGASLAYAFADRQTLLPHVFMAELSEQRELITQRLDEATVGSAVCEAAKDLRVAWVLDFGFRNVHGKVNTYAGIDTLTADKFELVKRVGDAKLYRFIGCDVTAE